MCVARVHRKHCSNARPRECVEWQIARHRIGGWQAAWLRRIPSCESGWNPHAYFGHGGNRYAGAILTRTVVANDIAAGLYEFKPSTWRGLGLPYRRIWYARWQAVAARRMLQQGRAAEWACR